MGIIWIVENQRKAPTIAAALVGDFAVRLFASLENFQTLARIERRLMPDAILVDLDSLESMGAERLAAAFKPWCEKAAVIFLGADATQCPSGLEFIQKPIESLHLSHYLNARIGAHQSPATALPRTGMITYRNLRFDRDHMTLTILPDETSHTLSRKEARLLQIFLDHPGKTLARERIAAVVWGENVKVSERTLDTHVSRLRKRLSEAEVTLESIYREGYVLR